MLMRSGEPPAPVTLPLLCALGRHKTDGLARWNAGYYFARCTRCRRDLVRTAFTRWQIPRGFRVVWQGDGAQAHGGELDRFAAPAGQVEFPLRDEPHGTPPSGPVEGEASGVLAGPEEDPPEAQVPDDADTRVEVMDEATDEVPPDARDDQPSWFDREHSFDEDVRFGADDRLSDYNPPEPEEEPEPEVEEPDDVAETAEVEPEPTAPPPPPVSSKYPVVPDFMEEGPAGVGWVVVSGHIVPSTESVEPAPDAHADPARDVPSGLLSQSWHDLVRKRAQQSSERGREWLRGRRARSPQPTREVAPEATVRAGTPRITVSGDAPLADDVVPVQAAPLPDAPPPAAAQRTVRPLGETLLQHSPLAAALIFGALVFAAAMVDGRDSPPRVVYRDAPVSAPASPTGDRPGAVRPGAARWSPVRSDIAYVTAGLLNCRATPRNDADTVRRLSRGAPLRVLAVTPGWIGVAHQGRQCWVAAQHISTTRPA